MLFLGKPFCEYIGDLFPSGGVFELKFFCFNFLLQEVVVHFDVLGAIMELRILGDSDGELVVHEEGSGSIWF